MTVTSPHTRGLDTADLRDGWRAAGVAEGMAVMVHSSLSALGYVEGGAAAVADSLCAAVGPSGTICAPVFTGQVADPSHFHSGSADASLWRCRGAVARFSADLPSTMGAVPEAVRAMPDSRRSSHPQVSVAAVGARAAEVVNRHRLGFAIGRDSPFGALHDLDGHILLVGVGHDRNTFLHYAESLTERPRLKLRRFPYLVDGERVWVEVFDVGDDDEGHFPVVGGEFEVSAGIRPVRIGNAWCRLLPVRPLVSFAVNRLGELLGG